MRNLVNRCDQYIHTDAVSNTVLGVGSSRGSVHELFPIFLLVILIFLTTFFIFTLMYVTFVKDYYLLYNYYHLYNLSPFISGS